MANKNDLIRFCRYYKGEKEIKETDPNKNTLCKIERDWIELTIRYDDGQTDVLSNALKDYIEAGLQDFEKFDDTPLTLKSLLFNRFIKYNERYDIEAFKKWYKQYYN